MHRTAAVIAVTLAVASPALAADWGKVADPKVCASASVRSQIHYYQACQAEVDKMVVACLSDPAMEKVLTAAGYVKGKPVPDKATETCEDEALDRIQKLVSEGDVEKAELPKATWKNPGVEKMIATAFKRDWEGEGQKLLKVILIPDKPNWEIERSPLGIITDRSVYAAAVYQKDDKCTVHSTYWQQQHNGKGFAGALEEHGAGATTDVGILCTKVK